MVKVNKKFEEDDKKEPNLAYQIVKKDQKFHIVTIDINTQKIINSQDIGFGFNENSFKVKKFFIELLNELYNDVK